MKDLLLNVQNADVAPVDKCGVFPFTKHIDIGQIDEDFVVEPDIFGSDRFVLGMKDGRGASFGHSPNFNTGRCSPFQGRVPRGDRINHFLVDGPNLVPFHLDDRTRWSLRYDELLQSFHCHSVAQYSADSRETRIVPWYRTKQSNLSTWNYTKDSILIRIFFKKAITIHQRIRFGRTKSISVLRGPYSSWPSERIPRCKVCADPARQWTNSTARHDRGIQWCAGRASHLLCYRRWGRRNRTSGKLWNNKSTFIWKFSQIVKCTVTKFCERFP